MSWEIAGELVDERRPQFTELEHAASAIIFKLVKTMVKPTSGGAFETP